MPRRVLVTGPSLDEDAVSLLEGKDCSLVFAGAYSEANELDRLIDECSPDAIISRMGKLSLSAISRAAPNLKVIAKHGVGVDNIDMDTATSLGIPVMVASGANAISVAEHALALILAVTKQVTKLDRSMRAGQWDKPNFQGNEIQGLTLGLFGMGAIALATARIAKSFGLRVIGFDPFVGSRRFEEAGVLEVGSSGELFSRSNILSLHAPLTEDTRQVVNDASLALMPKGGYVVNTARGGLIDEDALLRAIQRGHLAGAGLDTFAEEPIAPTHPFLSEPSIVLSPHISGVTAQANRRVAMQAARNVLAVLDGESIDQSLVINSAGLSRERDRVHERQEGLL